MNTENEESTTSTLNSTVNILSNIKVLTFDIKVWSGRKKLRPEDLKLKEGSELPPESLARLGSKLVMDPDKLAVFTALRQSAAREALFVGTRFLGGFAIPAEKVAALMGKIDALKVEFEAKKEEFLAGYSEAVQSWIKANPGWESVISNAQAEPDHVRKSLCFSTQVFNVTPVDEHQEGLLTEVTGLAGQLRHEIQVMAKDTWKSSYQGQQEVTRRALRPIEAMIRKIEGLVFLEPELNDLVEGFKETLVCIPPKGAIKGRLLADLCGILAVLGDIPEAKPHAVLTDGEEETVAGSLFQQEPEVAAEAEFAVDVEQETFVPAYSQKPSEAARPSEWF
ncbi:MAG: DUF3150 domain-containing protein [Nitrospirae bacterium]|nr:DUF3150 domain-containing protein [Nitrospirota bacterium]